MAHSEHRQFLKTSGTNKRSVRKWIANGTPWVWLNAGAVAVSIAMVVGLVGLIAVRGLVYFWPQELVELRLHAEHRQDSAQPVWAGRLWSEEIVSVSRLGKSGKGAPPNQDYVERMLVKTGNRDLDGFDFRWFIDFQIQQLNTPKDLTVVERREWGNFYGYLDQIKSENRIIASVENDGEKFKSMLDERLADVLNLVEETKSIEQGDIGKINFSLEKLRLKRKRLALENEDTQANLAEVAAAESELDKRYQALQSRRQDLYSQLEQDVLVVRTADGRSVDIPFSQIVNYMQPNSMGLFAKIKRFFINGYNFVSEEPREANTEGGVFPAIFGTVVMVLLMALLVTPFGVIAAIYLREYARQGIVTRTVRIAVNNLAGVPSIVYGVFGLGFFVYLLGGSIDELFYPEAAPAPVFGTPGLIWASLTLALLTVPVVIVATEEGLSRIPRAVKEGSYALGATKFETLWKVVIPMSSPAIMTGMILAVARAAGEVAPLMLVGVVKLAPTLPLDGSYPFLHLDRKFMHLGFHIYDVGFQSPNVEAARPLVYATAGLLVAVIGVLNLAAVYIRNNLREKYKSLEI